MNQLFAERFKSARLMNSLSLQDLSDILNNKISRQALHKYEKGEVLPDSEMMDLLCNALHVRPDFFTRTTIVELGEVSFRKLVKFPAKDQKSVIEHTKEILSRYLELEEILGIKEKFNHPIPDSAPILTFDDVEEFAKMLRKVWGLGTGPIFNVCELLEEKNVKIIEFEAEDGFDGLQTWVNGKETPVIVLNEAKFKSKRDRKRFTALHELAHLLLPFGDIDEKLEEKLCHRFASALLLPKKAVIKELGIKRNKISIHEFGFLKEQYGISIQAMVFRLNDLGIITDSYKRYYYRYINQMGWRVDEPYEYKGKEKSSRFNQLIFRALSEDIISMSKAASLNNMKLAEFRSSTLIIE